jgi:hypothetical protein
MLGYGLGRSELKNGRKRGDRRQNQFGRARRHSVRAGSRNRRDLNWKAITALLRAWDNPGQGEKMSLSRAERLVQKQHACKYDEDAKKLGITGPARIEYITARLGLPCGNQWASPKLIPFEEIGTHTQPSLPHRMIISLFLRF